MRASTTQPTHNTNEAQFLAPDTTQRAGRSRAGERQWADAFAVEAALKRKTWASAKPHAPTRVQGSTPTGFTVAVAVGGAFVGILLTAGVAVSPVVIYLARL